MQNRRSFLVGSLCIPITSAGCFSFSPDMEMESRAGGLLSQPLFTNGDQASNNASFTADIFTDPNVANSELNIDEEEALREDFLDFESDSHFLAVFASIFNINHTNHCPKSYIKGEELIFELAIGDWPAEIELPHKNLSILTLWNRNNNDPPEYASVKILHPDQNTDIATCPE